MENASFSTRNKIRFFYLLRCDRIREQNKKEKKRNQQQHHLEKEKCELKYKIAQ